MKNIFGLIRRSALFAVFAACASGPLIAHPGHGDPITKNAAVQRASSEINRLVEAGKLDKSWKLKAALQSAELGPKAESKEWTVVFSNSESSKDGEKTLYVFLTEQGEYLAANFTGK